MEEFKFPNGYPVSVAKKEDVLEAIDNNILDKEIAFEVIAHCEKECARMIESGEWSAIPYMGNFRKRETKIAMQSEESKDLLNTAKENLTREEYIIFRKDLTKDRAKQVSNTRYFRYEASKYHTKHKLLYNRLVKANGESYANIAMYCLGHLQVVANIKTYKL